MRNQSRKVFAITLGRREKVLRNVTVVYVKRQVRVIKDQAFYGCTCLSRVSYNRRLEVIGEKVFGRCRSLRSIKIPCTARAINDGAFEDCFGLLTADLGASVTQREDFSKDERERSPSKGCTVALKGFLTQTSSSPKWQEKDKSTNSKGEKQVQLCKNSSLISQF